MLRILFSMQLMKINSELIRIEYILKNCTYFEEDELDKYLVELQGNKSYLNHNKTIGD